ncbi:MAG: carbon storage regulator [Planctomycetota bacterium]
MLVLTRKHGEQIRIGDNITITVLRMKGKAVRLGIEAPADQSVLRGELAFEERTAPTPSADAPTSPSRDHAAAATESRAADPDKRKPSQPSKPKGPKAEEAKDAKRVAPLRAMVQARTVTA